MLINTGRCWTVRATRNPHYPRKRKSSAKSTTRLIHRSKMCLSKKQTLREVCGANVKGERVKELVPVDCSRGMLDA